MADSLYHLISESIEGESLPEGFSLPEDPNGSDGFTWADGAFDGVCRYHFGTEKADIDALVAMADAIFAASEGDYDHADELFLEASKKTRALGLIDDLQKFVIDHKNTVDHKQLLVYADHLITETTDRELVKYGLSLLELFDITGLDIVEEAVMTVGLSDEFTLFSTFVLRQLPNGNDDIFDLAKHVRGWGRIHCVEALEPATDEIRSWFLFEGIRNDVMSAYSALPCWKKSGAERILFGDPTPEELRAIRDILVALLEEGPCPGISEIENAENVILRFLDLEDINAFEPADYDAIREIRDHYDSDDTFDERIVDRADAILSRVGLLH